jgi:DNA-binding NarL/FixJ family response regulator
MSKILVVEDNPTFRETLKKFIASNFPATDVEGAENGKEALHSITDKQPDLIFMDIKLQKDNGLELTRKIKAAYPEVKVAIITQYDEDEYQRAALQFGADYFISKSTSDTKKIIRIIKSVIY